MRCGVPAPWRPRGVGALTLIGAGWAGGLVLMAFFLPSSASLTPLAGTSDLTDPKGDRRDGWQVLANGGIPALAVALGGPGALLAFAAGLAAAAADTWATAVGAHSRTPPRHILRGQVVSPGTSGGVTPLGTAGAAVGAALVAASAVPLVGWRGAGVAFGIGMGGMLLDSALGAGVQGRFHCDRCDRRASGKCTAVARRRGCSEGRMAHERRSQRTRHLRGHRGRVGGVLSATDADVLIAGAGPAGSAAAVHLARAGWRVVVVDRAAFPRDKPCSEYMSPEAVRLLDRLGVVPDLEAAGAVALRGDHRRRPRAAAA